MMLAVNQHQRTGQQHAPHWRERGAGRGATVITRQHDRPPHAQTGSASKTINRR
jgi:hypothetical protein